MARQRLGLVPSLAQSQTAMTIRRMEEPRLSMTVPTCPDHHMTRNIKSMTDQPVRGPVYNCMMLHTTRCYWLRNLLSCRCAESCNVDARCKLWCMRCIEQTVHPWPQKNLERPSKPLRFQSFCSCCGQMCSFQGACFCAGVLQTFASGADFYFITMYFSPAKLYHRKGPHAILTDVHWHLSVRIKSPTDRSGHWIKPLVRQPFQGSEITLSLSHNFLSFGDGIFLIQ